MKKIIFSLAVLFSGCSSIEANQNHVSILELYPEEQKVIIEVEQDPIFFDYELKDGQVDTLTPISASGRELPFHQINEIVMEINKHVKS